MAVYCVVIAAMLFMVWLERGREREATQRCIACGSRYGEKHHRDCHYKDR